MVTQDKKTLAATNAWMDYMQILRTTLSYMEGEYNRKSESNQRITMNDFMKVKKSVDSMLQKVNKERIIASQDVPQSTTATTSTATTTVTPPTTATSSNAITPSTTSSTTTEGMYYNSSVLNETKLNEIAYLCLGDIITEKQNLHNMKNNRIRLTESQLHNIIRRCVNEALDEYGETEFGQYQLGRLAQRQKERNNPYGSITDTDAYKFAQKKQANLPYEKQQSMQRWAEQGARNQEDLPYYEKKGSTRGRENIERAKSYTQDRYWN